MGNPDLFRSPQEMRELELLRELEKNPIISQRELSHKFGIALGLTNVCLRKMVRKGWIRVTNFNHHKIGYFLTPVGFAEKTKLSLHLISCTIHHYSELKKIIGKRLLEMERDGRKRVIFYGVSDEMEVAYITLQGVNLKLVGIVEDDEKFKPQFIFGYELERVSRVAELKPDCVLITALSENEKKKETLEKIFGSSSICIKDICSR